MSIDFPNSPATDQTFESGGRTWKYDGEKWIVVGTEDSQEFQLSLRDNLIKFYMEVI